MKDLLTLWVEQNYEVTRSKTFYVPFVENFDFSQQNNYFRKSKNVKKNHECDFVLIFLRVTIIV